MIKLLVIGLILYVCYRIYKFSWRLHQTIDDMRRGGGGQATGNRSNQRYESGRRSGKVYSKDVGEYVDYEEIDRVVEQNTGEDVQTEQFCEESRVSDAEYEDIKSDASDKRQRTRH